MTFNTSTAGTDMYKDIFHTLGIDSPHRVSDLLKILRFKMIVTASELISSITYPGE